MAKRIMFVCTGNSARSQMAEGLARALGGNQVEVFSAGLEPKGLHPVAVGVMKEIGIDISSQTSKLIDPDLIRTMDIVVTLCGDARDRCPVLPPGTVHIHWPLPDPAAVEGSEAEVREAFRRVRSKLQELVTGLLQNGKDAVSKA